jgi:hypothetical protein
MGNAADAVEIMCIGFIMTELDVSQIDKGKEIFEYIYICLYLCMYIYVCVLCMYLCMYICMYLCIHI